MYLDLKMSYLSEKSMPYGLCCCVTSLTRYDTDYIYMENYSGCHSTVSVIWKERLAGWSPITPSLGINTKIVRLVLWYMTQNVLLMWFPSNRDKKWAVLVSLPLSSCISNCLGNIHVLYASYLENRLK